MKIILPFLLLFPFLSSAQLFDPTTIWFEDEDFFNQEFIKEHSIKAFRSKFSSKKDDEVINESLDFVKAEFNNKGETVILTIGSGWIGKVDSTVYAFTYTPSSIVKTQDVVMSPIHYYYMYEHNEKGNIIKETKLDVSKLPTKVISTKNYKVEKITENREKKTFLNDAGKPYIQEITELIDGRLTYRRMEYVVNSTFKEEEFIYENDQLQYKTIKSNIGKNVNRKFSYSYLDDGKNFDEILISENGKETHKIAFVYNRPKIPRAMIVRDYVKKTIDIYEFSYKFY